MFRKKRDPGEAPDQPAPTTYEPGGEALLADRGIMAEWVGRWYLAKEMARCLRHDSPLTVAVLTPQLFGSSESVPAGVYVGATALAKLARTTDVVAWYGSSSFMVILPETEHHDAEVAVQRWCVEMWRRSLSVDGVKWAAGIVSASADFDSPDALLEAAATRAARHDEKAA